MSKLKQLEEAFIVELRNIKTRLKNLLPAEHHDAVEEAVNPSESQIANHVAQAEAAPDPADGADAASEVK